MKKTGPALLVVTALAVFQPGFGGIDGTGRSFGWGGITRFGSIVVGGMELATDTAIIKINGAPATEGDLRAGQVVDFTAHTHDDEAGIHAETVNYHDLLRGPIEAINRGQASLQLVGQIAEVSGLTVFGQGPDALEDLVVGDWLAVSGKIGADGVIGATWVAPIEAGDYQLVGAVSGLDQVGGTFSINALQVDYSLAEAPPDLAEGEKVIVTGANLAGGILSARTVARVALSTADNPGDMFALRGETAAVVPEVSFEVDGQSILLLPETTYRNGQAANLTPGARLQVHGQVDQSGDFLALTVEFLPESDDCVTATVQTVDVDAGKLSALGVDVRLRRNSTVFLDESVLQIRRFSLADIHVGDYVSVCGTVTGGNFQAAGLVREMPEAGVRLTGVGQRVNDATLRVLGVSATAEDDDWEAFVQQATGRRVRITGQTVGATVVVSEAWIVGTEVVFPDEDDDQSDDEDDDQGEDEG